MILRSDIEAAAARLQQQGPQGFLRATPLWRLPGATLGVAAAEVWLKLELFQKTGTFKLRGALNNIAAMDAAAARAVCSLPWRSSSSLCMAASCSA